MSRSTYAGCRSLLGIRGTRLRYFTYPASLTMRDFAFSGRRRAS